MASLRNLSMVIGAAVAALGSVLFIAWSRYVPGRRKWRRTGSELEYRQLYDQDNYLDCQILVLGLDGAGKSSIIHAISTNTTRSCSAPTHGFNTAQILSQGLRIELLEDSTDDIRLPLARHELHRLLEEAPQLPLMVLANKQDCKSALSMSDIHSELSLHRIQGVREVMLLGTSAVYDGYGSSTSLQTVRAMLEERLHKVKRSEESTNHLQSDHCKTSLSREKSA
ncbi:ADP-ribosylation factor-like protein 10 isoform X2 [Rhinoderma darwinii]|uniref:ADP-ribosylation factor-like protein 10 isoform X2 n=1 Tax=Rhinoderma darwinii TaxID=43563 RepID=UPI003F673C69